MRDFLIHIAGIGTYLVEAAIIYGLVTHEFVGFPLLLVAGLGFLYLAGYVLWGLRRVRPLAAAGEAEAVEAEEEPHVGPTIWPLVFALSTVLLTVGAILSRWVLVAGGAVFLAAAVGWFLDVLKQWRHPATPAVPTGPATDVEQPEQRA